MSSLKSTSQSSSEMKRTLSLLSCVTLVIGAMIGSGVFVFTGYGILLGGKSIGAAFIIASLLVLFTSLPNIYSAGAIPATGGQYMYVSRLVHPTVGYIHILNATIGIFNVALMGASFATYFKPFAPALDVRITACAAILVLAVAATYGAKISGMLQNVIVAIMLLALLSFVIPGLGKVQAQFVTVGEAFIPDWAQFAKVWAAVAILRYTLMGGGVIFPMGDEVKNPRVTLPAAFFIGTIIVTALYALIGYIAVGVMPFEEIAGKPLSVAAAVVLGENTGMFSFFVVGGAMLGILSTLNGSFMIYSRTHYAAAKDGIWPQVFAKLNKYGVPWVTVWTCAVVGFVVILGGLHVNDIMNFVAVPGLLMAFVYYIPPIMIAYKLPNCAKRAWFKIPQPLLIGICVISVIVMFTLGRTLFARMQPSHYIGMIIFYIIGFIYWFFRTNYMKKQGKDLIGNMKTLHPYWLEIENKLDNEA